MFLGRLLMISLVLLVSSAAVSAEKYFVKLNNQKSLAPIRIESFGFQIQQEFSQLRLLLIEPGEGMGKKQVKANLKKIMAMSSVEYVEKEIEVKIAAEPDDTKFSRQKHHRIIGSQVAWQHETGSKDVVVAITDTGITLKHLDLKDNLWVNAGEIPDNGIDDDNNGHVDDVHGWDFYANTNDPGDGNGHGSHVAGLVAATGNNGYGVTGVAWSTSLMALKFLNGRGRSRSGSAVASILYAVDNGAHIINASWGSDYYSQAIYDAIAYAEQHGILFVSAAGNYQKDIDKKPFYPAAYGLDNIITVGAGSKKKASFSNKGAVGVDLFAPGTKLLSAGRGKKSFKYLSGTSMAAPVVAGAAALLKARNPSWQASELKQALMSTVKVEEKLRGLCATSGYLQIGTAIQY